MVHHTVTTRHSESQFVFFVPRFSARNSTKSTWRRGNDLPQNLVNNQIPTSIGSWFLFCGFQIFLTSLFLLWYSLSNKCCAQMLREGVLCHPRLNSVKRLSLGQLLQLVRKRNGQLHQRRNWEHTESHRQFANMAELQTEGCGRDDRGGYSQALEDEKPPARYLSGVAYIILPQMRLTFNCFPKIQQRADSSLSDFLHEDHSYQLFLDRCHQTFPLTVRGQSLVPASIYLLAQDSLMVASGIYPVQHGRN